MTQPVQSEPPSAGRFERGDTPAVLALSVLVAASYLPAMLWGGFVWDDQVFLRAESVRQADGLWRIWFSPGDIDGELHYWPLTYTTFWLEHRLWGFAPAGYHAVNVLMHLANTLLLWRLLLRLAVPGAWVAAAVFAVHPVHVEPVAWIIGRKDLLSGLFYLAAALTYMRWVQTPRAGRYALALGLFTAGMLSKSTAVTLPAALLIWHWWKQGRVSARDLLRLAPFFAVGLAVTAGDLSYSASRLHLSLDYSAVERMLIAARALWFYAGKLAWPADLAGVYALWEVRAADPLAWGYVAAAGAVAAALWFLRRRTGRGPLAGALFFAVMLSPVLGFVDHNYMKDYSFVADRYQYLASAALLAAVIGAAAHAVGAARAAGRWPDLAMKGSLGAVAATLAVLGMLTWQQAAIYRDNETFHRHVIATNPRSWSAHHNLAGELFRQGRTEEALAAARAAAKLCPGCTGVNLGLGMILLKQGRSDSAEKHFDVAISSFEHAVAEAPDWSGVPGLYVSMAKAALATGRLEKAATYYTGALRSDPRHMPALLGLARVRFRQQRYGMALPLLRTILEIEPDNARAHANKAVALYQTGRTREALESINRALALDPTLEGVGEGRARMLKNMEERGRSASQR